MSQTGWGFRFLVENSINSFYDFRLQWNESDFGGASVFRINPKKIWLPDIEIYNTAVSITG